MKRSKHSRFKIATHLDVVRPSKESAYPIPLAEWQFLRAKIEHISQPSRWYNSIGSFFFGISGSSLVAALALPTNAETRIQIICWITFGFAAVLAAVFLFFDNKIIKSLESSTKQVALEEMTRLESRFTQA